MLPQIIYEKCGTDVSLLVSDVYEADKFLAEKFDIVFTSYGVIGWLPDLDRWAKIISHFLKPKGKFIFAEFHPFVWMYDDNFTDVTYSYFNTGAINEVYDGTYAQKDAPISQEYVMWNHATSEVLQSLLKHNLALTSFQEFNWSPYPFFSSTVEFEKGKFRIPQFEDRIPIVFALTAQKKTDTL